MWSHIGGNNVVRYIFYVGAQLPTKNCNYPARKIPTSRFLHPVVINLSIVIITYFYI